MKKIILFLLLSTCTFQVKAQFELTPSGLVNKDNPDVNYIIFEYDSVPQSILFDNVEKCVDQARKIHGIKIYKFPADLITIVAEKVKIGNGAIMSGRLSYKMDIKIKDGKIRVDIADFIIEGLKLNKDGNQTYIFDKKGDLKNKEVKNQIEKKINPYVEDIHKRISIHVRSATINF
jgi:hypothetical protein